MKRILGVACIIMVLLGMATSPATAQTADETVLRVLDDYTSFTRDEPMRVGESALFSLSGCTVIMTYKEVISGKNAAQMVSKANRFNTKPGKGEQYYIAHFDISISGGDRNKSVSFSKFNFDVVSKAGKMDSRTTSVAGLDDSLKLFHDASGDIYVPALANDKEAPYLLFKDEIWIDLSALK